MERYPGVFVTSSTTDEWGPDSEVPGSAMHELVHADGLHAGLSRFTEVDGPVPWTPERREVALILEELRAHRGRRWRVTRAGSRGILSRPLPAAKPPGTSRHRSRRCGSRPRSRRTRGQTEERRCLPRSPAGGRAGHAGKVPRQAIKTAAPTATEKIGYGMPGFSYEGRYLVYYAAFKDHCSFFPASGGVMEEFAKELERYDVSKGTIRFPIGKPLPATLVKKLVKARIREIRGHPQALVLRTGRNRPVVDNVIAWTGEIRGLFHGARALDGGRSQRVHPLADRRLAEPLHGSDFDLPAPWDNLGDPLVLGVVGVVGVADFIGDKVPIVDHVLHVMGSCGRAGRRRAARARVRERVRPRPGVTAGLGVAAALATQVGRTAARPVSTAMTGGGGNPVVSLGEDGVSGALAVTAVVWPAVAAVLALLVLVAVFLLWRKWSQFRSSIQRRGSVQR